MTACSDRDCQREALMAIRTTRPTRAELKSTVWYEESAAPKAAERFCREHGAELIANLVCVLVPPDDATPHKAP